MSQIGYVAPAGPMQPLVGRSRYAAVLGPIVLDDGHDAVNKVTP